MSSSSPLFSLPLKVQVEIFKYMMDAFSLEWNETEYPWLSATKNTTDINYLFQVSKTFTALIAKVQPEIFSGQFLIVRVLNVDNPPLHIFNAPSVQRFTEKIKTISFTNPHEGISYFDSIRKHGTITFPHVKEVGVGFCAHQLILDKWLLTEVRVWDENLLHLIKDFKRSLFYPAVDGKRPFAAVFPNAERLVVAMFINTGNEIMVAMIDVFDNRIIHFIEWATSATDGLYDQEEWCWFIAGSAYLRRPDWVWF